MSKTKSYVYVNGMRIPVDEKGYVPEEALLKRYETFYSGKREGSDKRDYNQTSDKVIPLKCTPEQVAYWWRDPSRADVEYIDCTAPPKYNTAGLSAAQREAQAGIGVIGTDGEEKKVRRDLAATYTVDDLKKIAASSPIYSVQYEPKGLGGQYKPWTTRIELDRDLGMEQGTITHETSHLLRYTDKDRKDPRVKACHSMIGVEESCTVAEQMARSDKPDYNGYYEHVPVYDEKRHCWRSPTPSEARRMAEEDHMLFTYGRGKGLKEDAALESVERNWSSSHICRLQHGSSKMAINTAADAGWNVERVSMAKPTSKAAAEAASKREVTNATAGKPGVVATGKKQTTLFDKSKSSKSKRH